LNGAQREVPVERPEPKRLERLRRRLREEGYEALLVTNPYNRRYLTGFTGSSGYVLVTESRQILLSDFRYRTQAGFEAPDVEFVEHAARAEETIGECLRSLGVTRLAIEAESVTVADLRKYEAAWPGVQLEPVEGLVAALRAVKDDVELAVIREAARLADRTFDHLLGWIRPGLTEREVAIEIEMFLRRHGASSSSFDTIVASGERSALPHGVATDRRLGVGEFVKLDFGAYYRGYCSDLTRTIVLGKPTDRQRELYAVVLEAQETCLRGIRPGMTGREADALARDVIRRYGYEELFGHGTGHGIGLEIHEAPRLSPTSESVLAAGMTVTVEPGIYVPGFGGVRIEDDVVLTAGGAETLTAAPKQLISV